ncbi:hypothetical protein [Pyxidicoccus xibeiensis]|uniref:hypothetical protein n=1 Tax=Pyxidicoccus xibeiensis TaxID=2906759 RepID=UPI0020A8331E|nr:hypothetical protein [Pyxidicoccus xibeiensis]MCP3135832.1 hypothetical protein [Pyxidicoccus xibeiensis]
MTAERYHLGLGESGRLKLRATALLAEGGSERAFEAAALLHDAARAEARALLTLEHPTPEVRLASAIEQCACLVEGLDPVLASRAWGQVLEAAGRVPEPLSVSMLTRLKPRYFRLESAFGGALRKSPLVARHSGSLELLRGRERQRYVREAGLLLARFPGTPWLWWVSCRIEHLQGRPRAAWDAIQRACRLEPDNGHYDAVRLWLMPRVVPPKQVDAYLSEAYAGIHHASPEVCLVYALNEMELVRRGPSAGTPRLERAFEAVLQGRSRVPAESAIGQYLRAAWFLLSEQLKGGEPTIDLLYRAGLGDLIVASPVATRKDPFRLLSQQVTQVITRHAA